MTKKALFFFYSNVIFATFLTQIPTHINCVRSEKSFIFYEPPSHIYERKRLVSSLQYFCGNQLNLQLCKGFVTVKMKQTQKGVLLLPSLKFHFSKENSMYTNTYYWIAFLLSLAFSLCCLTQMWHGTAQLVYHAMNSIPSLVFSTSCPPPRFQDLISAFLFS